MAIPARSPHFSIFFMYSFMSVGLGNGGMKLPILLGAVLHGGCGFVLDTGSLEGLFNVGLASGSLCAGVGVAAGTACCQASSRCACVCSWPLFGMGSWCGLYAELSSDTCSYTRSFAHGLCCRTANMKTNAMKERIANLRGDRTNMLVDV